MTDDELVALYARASADHFKECHGCGGGAHKAGLRAIQAAVSPEEAPPSMVLVPRESLKKWKEALQPFWFSGDYGDYNNEGVIDTSNEIEALLQTPPQR